MQPKQAKDQLLRMLDEAGPEELEKVNRDVVTMLKSMPLDKRKKIVSEFKTDEEAEKLHEILKQIREGVPDLTLIHETREQLASFSPCANIIFALRLASVYWKYDHVDWTI